MIKVLALDGDRRALGHVYSATTFVGLGSLAVIYAHGRREGLLGTMATAGFVMLVISILLQGSIYKICLSCDLVLPTSNGLL